jgi:lipid II:glycine glycyltransferase (peptidoglycan interpeptide bridge formation enzyme)
VLFQFLQYIEEDLRKSAIKKIIIKNPPTLYNPQLQTLLQVFLSNLAYRINTAEPGAIFIVDKSGKQLSSQWEKRKVKQAHEKELKLRHEGVDQLNTLYTFIHSCRVQKGYPSSMTVEDLRRTVNTFPERFLLTSIHKKKELVAASICVRCNSHVLYHFYSDHNTLNKTTNPTVFLIRSLYEYCFKNRIALFDLGTSSIGGIPNFGLLNFKLRLNATPTTKFTFEKDLTD